MSLLKTSWEQNQKLGFGRIIFKSKQNPQILFEYQKKYKKLHPEKFLHSLDYYKKNWEKNKKKINEKRLKNKILIINHYTNGKNCCSCCGESNIIMLNVDHIYDNGNLQRKKLGTGHQFYYWLIRNNFPKGFQILCFNCNYGRFMNNGICPHKK